MATPTAASVLARGARDEDEDGGDGGGVGDGDGVIDLRGVPLRLAAGSRVQVSYMERQGRTLVAVPYRGTVVSVDEARGLRVKLDGFSRREWVTDEDEWSWCAEHDSAPLPHQLELMAQMEQQQSQSQSQASSSSVGAAEEATAAAVDISAKGGRGGGGGVKGGRGGGFAAAAATTTAAAAAAAPTAARRLRRRAAAFMGVARPLRLRGMANMELPRSHRDAPRRSSGARPLPYTLLGAAAEAKDAAYDAEIAREKERRRVSRPESKQQREERRQLQQQEEEEAAAAENGGGSRRGGGGGGGGGARGQGR